MKANEIIVEYVAAQPAAQKTGIIGNLRAAGRQNQADMAANIKQGAKNLAMKLPGAKAVAGLHSKLSDFAMKAKDAADVSRAADQWVNLWAAEVEHLNTVRRQSGQPAMTQAEYNKGLEQWLEKSLKVNADPSKMSQYVRNMDPRSLKNYFQQYFIPQYIKSQQQAGAAQGAAQPAGQTAQAPQAAAPTEIAQAFNQLDQLSQSPDFKLTPKQRGEIQSLWKSMGGTRIAESRQLRVSLYEGLTNGQVRSVKLWESAGRKLVEADLTAQQISNIFAAVQRGATAAGGNRTAIGQGKDAASAVAKAWDNLKGKVSTSKPIKDLDAAYDLAAEKLKQATGGDTGVMRYVEKYRAFAKKHPVAQSFLYAALIAAAGLSGAGAGGAAALGLLKMTDKLLQGEKFSSAAYSGAKTGAVAGAASAALGGTAQAADDYMPPGSAYNALERGSDIAASTVGSDPRSIANAAFETVKQKIAGGEVTDYNSYQQALSDAINQTVQSGGNTANGQTRQFAYKLLRSKLEGIAAKAAGGEFSGSGPEIVAKIIDTLGGTVDQDSINASKNVAQGLARESAVIFAAALTESQVRQIFRRVERRELAEGLMDTVKQAAGQAGQWVRTKGENLTTKVTADKLQQAWKAAGSPMDSDAVAQIIRDAGVSNEIIDNVFKSLNISTPAAPTAGEQAQVSKIDDIIATIKSFVADGGTVTPKMRGIVKDLWMRSGGTQIAERRR